MLKLLERMAAFDVSCPHGGRGRCVRSVCPLSGNLDEVAGAVRSISGRVEGTLLASARPAVMAGGVASIGARSLFLPALRTPAPIRAPPRCVLRYRDTAA